MACFEFTMVTGMSISVTSWHMEYRMVIDKYRGICPIIIGSASPPVRDTFSTLWTGKFRDDVPDKDIFLSVDTIFSLFEEWSQDKMKPLQLNSSD